MGKNRNLKSFLGFQTEQTWSQKCQAGSLAVKTCHLGLRRRDAILKNRNHNCYIWSLAGFFSLCTLSNWRPTLLTRGQIFYFLSKTHTNVGGFMLASSNATISLMRKALARTAMALEIAAEIDATRTDDDKKFLANTRQRILPLLEEAITIEEALETYDEGDGLRFQARVELGDAVLDEGLRNGKSKTKALLRGQSGLGAEHVFGDDISEMTDAPVAQEPELVLTALLKMVDLPKFPGREELADELTALANKQKQILQERNVGTTTRTTLSSTATRIVVQGADLLASVKGDLDSRFPRQKKYVSSFFLDVAPTPKKRLHPKAEAILSVLEARSIALNDEQEKKITSSTDDATLSSWLTRSVSITTGDQLFG
jgi:hypothetical protein